MYRLTIVTLIGLLTSFISHAENSNKNSSNWQTIEVSPHMTINDDGQPREIQPSCAMDYIQDPVSGELLDNSFRFYFKQGTSSNLVIYFNGGGACWNDASCVESLALQNVEGMRPSYNPTVLSQNSPENAGGIFDDTRLRNAFKDWSKVYIPYCTGDLHVGSKDVLYHDKTGHITGATGTPFLIKHRGFDNFLAVKDWLKSHYTQATTQPKKVMVTGSSAGGYGASLNFPYLHQLFNNSKMYLFADASAWVVTDGFLQDVFAANKSWGLENTFNALFADKLGTFSADNMNEDIMTTLTERFPNSRFSQYITNKDIAQIEFYKIMQQMDEGQMNPFLWQLSTSELEYFTSWYQRATQSFDNLASQNANYQYYIAAGAIHTILTDDFATAEMPHPFYDQWSAQFVPFTLWIRYFADSSFFIPVNLKAHY